MNRGNMRRLLRRRLNDVSTDTEAQFFTDAELNEALDMGASKIEKAVLAIDKTATMKITRQNVEANEPLYPKPAGVWSVLDVKLLDPTSGEYRSLGDPISIEDLEKLSTVGNTTVRYAHIGRWIQLGPVPSAAITNGLEWRTIFGVEIADGEDNDGQVYPFPTGLHNAVVLWAQLILTPEFEAGVNTDEIRKQLAEDLGDIPMYFSRTVGREVPFSLDLTKVGAGR